MSKSRVLAIAAVFLAFILGALASKLTEADRPFRFPLHFRKSEPHDTDIRLGKRITTFSVSNGDELHIVQQRRDDPHFWQHVTIPSKLVWELIRFIEDR